MAEAQDKITDEAVEQYLKTQKEQEKHFMIAAGPANAPMLANQA